MTLGQFRIGDRVKWVGKNASKVYCEALSNGIVVKVTDKRVVVMWNKASRPRNHTPNNLIKIG